MEAQSNLPSNPFQLEPIKELDKLAGRAIELSELRYYCQSAASGHSCCVALIGPRGIGKTSILLSSHKIIRELSLLNVNVDLNDYSIACPARFWQAAYSAMCFEAAQQGCWDGISGETYRALSSMVDARSYTNLDVPFQFPIILSKYTGDIAELNCPANIIAHDLSVMIETLRKHQINGIILAIDEGDGIATDHYILQSLRNVIQKVDGITILLSGTELFFSSITTEFPPIQRQFHKIELGPIHGWVNTYKFVHTFLPKELHNSIGPTAETLKELDELCAGEPYELQLYCYEMYKAVVQNSVKRMELTPQIYRAVSEHYKAGGSETYKRVLGQIEELAPNIALNCPWLQHAALNSNENANLWIAFTELENGIECNEIEKTRTIVAVQDSYRLLYSRGISRKDDRLDFHYESFVRGFWKSYVCFSMGERWSWTNERFEDLLAAHIYRMLCEKTSGKSISLVPPDGTDYLATILAEDLDIDRKEFISILESITKMLQQVSSEASRQDIDLLLTFFSRVAQVIDFIPVLTKAYRSNSNDVLRIPITIEIGNRSFVRIFSYLGFDKIDEKLSEIQATIEERSHIFQKSGVKLTVGTPVAHKIPSYEIIQRVQNKLGISLIQLPDLDIKLAIKLFEEGKIADSCKLFERVNKACNNVAHVLNNIAFCKLLLNEPKEAREQLKLALEKEQNELYLHNLAIAEFLLENKQAAKDAWDQAELLISTKGSIDTPLYTLIIEADQPLPVHRNSLSVIEAIKASRIQCRS